MKINIDNKGEMKYFETVSYMTKSDVKYSKYYCEYEHGFKATKGMTFNGKGKRS